MTTPVSTATEKALRDAMESLLARQTVKTDGRLTVINLAIEAGVSRATANRADAVLSEFRRRVAAFKEEVERPAETIRESFLNESRNAHILAQHIQVLALFKQKTIKDSADIGVIHFNNKRQD